MIFLSYGDVRKASKRFKALAADVQKLLDRNTENDRLIAENAAIKAELDAITQRLADMVAKTDTIEAGARAGLPSQ